MLGVIGVVSVVIIGIVVVVVVIVGGGVWVIPGCIGATGVCLWCNGFGLGVFGAFGLGAQHAGRKRWSWCSRMGPAAALPSGVPWWFIVWFDPPQQSVLVACARHRIFFPQFSQFSQFSQLVPDGAERWSQLSIPDQGASGFVVWPWCR